MLIPPDGLCRVILDEMEHMDELNEWEHEFVDSNSRRTEFTDKQKEIIRKFADKYDFNCTRNIGNR